MDNSKEEKRSQKKKDSTLKNSKNSIIDNQDESQDKGKKKIKKGDSTKTRKSLKTSNFKPPSPRNSELCSLCGFKEDKLFEMKCNSNHFVCFKCLYDFLIININEFINEKNNKNNKKVTILKCPKCFNINNSGGAEFKNSELLS